MSRHAVAYVFQLFGLFAIPAFVLGTELERWYEIDGGLESARFSSVIDSSSADSAVIVIRIDPRKWNLTVRGRMNAGEPENLTARQWCRRQQLVVAINAGMFQQDYVTHVGYLKIDDHVHARRVKSYQSAAAFGPKRDSLPPFKLFDLDKDSLSEIVSNYAIVCQNLRLIDRERINRWSQQERQWTEAALGEDDKGNALFIFCSRAMTMHDFNKLLLSLPIGLVAAQHLEGGPEAQLFLKLGNTEIERLGIFETSLNSDYDSSFAYPIPNVIGVTEKK